MSSLDAAAGQESVQTSLAHVTTSASSTLQSHASSTSTISTFSTISTVFFLSLFALVCICWIRRRRTISKVPDERSSEKEAIHDVEALAADPPIVPVTPVVDVRWIPQIRSISGPRSEQDTDRKSATLFPKRVRSPPPSNFSKPRSLFPDSTSYPKSAPVHMLSFPQDEIQSANLLQGELSPPVTPSAVAVSGMETRSLGRPGLGSKN